MPTATERVLAAYDAWNRDAMDEWLEAMHPEVEFDAPGIFPGFDRVYRGRDGMARFWRHMHEPWDSFSIDVERLEERGDDFILAIRLRAKGAGSGAGVDMRFGHAMRLRDGLIIVLVARTTADEAAANLGA